MKKTTLWIVALLAVATLAGCNKAPVENPVQENVNENPVEENIEVENIEENVEEQPVVEETNYEVDYGTSELYSKEDMDSAIAAIMNEFNNEWQVKCEMHKIYYAGDEISQKFYSTIYAISSYVFRFSYSCKSWRSWSIWSRSRIHKL